METGILELIMQGGPWGIVAILSVVVAYLFKTIQELHGRIYELGLTLVRHVEQNTSTLTQLTEAINHNSTVKPRQRD